MAINDTENSRYGHDTIRSTVDMGIKQLGAQYLWQLTLRRTVDMDITPYEAQ